MVVNTSEGRSPSASCKNAREIVIIKSQIHFRALILSQRMGIYSN